jgi:hypothetical protein
MYTCHHLENLILECRILSVMNRNSNEMELVAYNFEPEYSEEKMT